MRRRPEAFPKIRPRREGDSCARESSAAHRPLTIVPLSSERSEGPAFFCFHSPHNSMSHLRARTSRTDRAVAAIVGGGTNARPPPSHRRPQASSGAMASFRSTSTPSRGSLYVELPRGTNRALFWVSLATGSAPIRSGSTAARAAPTRSSASIATAIACWWCSRTPRSAPRSTTRRTAHRRRGFPPSTVASLPVVAEEGDRILVDVTDFAYRDWNDVAGTLARRTQGTLRGRARPLERSTAPYTKAFPENTEIDVALTFATTGAAGRHRRARSCPTAARSRCASTSRFLPLPDDGIPAARARSARRLLRHHVQGLRAADPARRSSSAGSRATASSA